MEAADGSGRKRPRSAVDVSEDDGAGANAGEVAQVDVVAEDAAAKRQRTEVSPLAQDSSRLRAALMPFSCPTGRRATC